MQENITTHKVIDNGKEFNWNKVSNDYAKYRDIYPDIFYRKTSEQLVLKYNPHWTGSGMKRYIPEIPEETKELFVVEHAICYDLNVTFTRENWHGRIKACRGIGASSLTDDEIAQFEQEHLAYLNIVPKEFDIPHFVTILNLRKIVSFY